MNPLSPRAQKVIAAASGESPSASDKSRVRAELAARLALLPPVASFHPPAVAAPAAASVTASKIVLGSVIAASMGSVAVWGAHRVTTHRPEQPAISRAHPVATAPSPSPVASTPPMVHAVGPTPTSKHARPALFSTSRPAAQTEASIPSDAPDPSADDPSEAQALAVPEPPAIDPPRISEPPPPPVTGWTVAQELAALRDAETALTNRPHYSLEVLDRYSADCPHARFAPERELMRILALCALDRMNEARTAADAFRALWGSSPLIPRLDASCASQAGR